MKEKERHFFTQRNKDGTSTPKKGSSGSKGEKGKVNGESSTASKDTFSWPEDEEGQGDPKKWSANFMEKRRRDRIKAGIMRLGELLPAEYALQGHQTTNEILDNTIRFMQDYREKKDHVILEGGDKAQAEEIKALRKQLEEVTLEKERLHNLIKTFDPTSNWSGYKKNPNTEALERMAATQLATLADRVEQGADPGPDAEAGVRKDSPKTKKRTNLVSEQLKRRDEASKAGDPSSQENAGELEPSQPTVPSSIPTPNMPVPANMGNAIACTGMPMMSPVPPVTVSPGIGLPSMWPSPLPGNMMGPSTSMNSGLLQIAPGVASSGTDVTLSPSTLVAGTPDVASPTVAMPTSQAAQPISQAPPDGSTATSSVSVSQVQTQGQMSMPQMQPNVSLPFNPQMMGNGMFPSGPIPVGTVQNAGLQGTIVLGPNGQLILVNENTPQSALQNMGIQSMQSLNNLQNMGVNSMGQQVNAMGGQVVPNNENQQQVGSSHISVDTSMSTRTNEQGQVVSTTNTSGNVVNTGSQVQTNMQMSSSGSSAVTEPLIGLPPVATQGITQVSANHQQVSSMMQNSNMAASMQTQQTVVSSQPQMGMPVVNQNLIGQPQVFNQSQMAMQQQPAQLIGQPQAALPGQNVHMSNQGMQMTNQNAQMGNQGLQMANQNAQMVSQSVQVSNQDLENKFFHLLLFIQGK